MILVFIMAFVFAILVTWFLLMPIGMHLITTGKASERCSERYLRTCTGLLFLISAAYLVAFTALGPLAFIYGSFTR